MNTTQGSPHGTSRKIAIIVGVLFLTAMVTSLLGGGLLDSILSASDYLIAVSENETQLIIGVLLELINAIAVVGIGVLMFPILKQHNETIALGYLGFRIIESVFCSVIVISPLSLMALSQEYLKAGASDAPPTGPMGYFQTLGAISIAERASVVGLLIPVFFSLGALLFYYLLYQSKLIPRFISVWGLIGVALILTLNLLSTSNLLEVDISTGLIFALPIMTNEIFLAIWLIVKGFNPSAIASGSAKQI
jgi:hypothetical protein